MQLNLIRKPPIIFPEHLMCLLFHIYRLQLIDSLVGFDIPEVEVEEESDEMSPQMLRVLERIEKQEAK